MADVATTSVAPEEALGATPLHVSFADWRLVGGSFGGGWDRTVATASFGGSFGVGAATGIFGVGAAGFGVCTTAGFGVCTTAGFGGCTTAGFGGGAVEGGGFAG